MTLLEIKKAFSTALLPHYRANEIEAMYFALLQDKYGLSRIEARMNEFMTCSRANDLMQDIKRLQTMEPLQHITGLAHFCGMKIHITPDVLIPRPETEELVELITREVHDGNKLRWLDVGTGSGCIALALKKKYPQATVLAIDVSPAALEVARANAKNLSLDVHFQFMDISNVEGLGTFDVVVSNPPYIPVNQFDTVDQSVVTFEPHLALFAPAHDELFFYRAIQYFARNHLTKPNGKLYFETHYNRAAQVEAIFSDQAQTRVFADMSGINRFVEVIY